MSAPRRMLSDPSLLESLADDSLARDLLESGRDIRPPASAKAHVWGQLEGLVGAAALGGGGLALTSASASASGGSPMASVDPSQGVGPASSAAPASTSVVATSAASVGASTAAGVGVVTVVKTGAGLALGTKLGLLGMVLGGGLFAATLMTEPAPKLTMSPVSEVASDDVWIPPSGLVHGKSRRASAERSTNAEVEPQASDVTSPAPIGHAHSKGEIAKEEASAPAPAAEKAHNRLREANGVTRARSLLASGDPKGALDELAAMEREVSKGSMGPERYVLTVEALAASGRGEEASKHARAFIERNPDSPYAKRLARYAY